MVKLAGKVSIVIGAGIAKVFARHDADVILTDDSVANRCQIRLLH